MTYYKERPRCRKQIEQLLYNLRDRELEDLLNMNLSEGMKKQVLKMMREEKDD